MDHIFARLKGINIEDIKSVLRTDAAERAKHGLVLRHVWKNSDDPEEIVFIFTAADHDHARKHIEEAYEEMLIIPVQMCHSFFS